MRKRSPVDLRVRLRFMIFLGITIIILIPVGLYFYKKKDYKNAAFINALIAALFAIIVLFLIA
jgi:hypothetical protein